MRKQQRLDFLRRDILAAANDDILLAVGDEQIALGIEPADVAGAVPAARQEGARIERGVELTEKKLRPARGELARGTGRHRMAGVVDEAHFGTAGPASPGSGLPRG